MEKFFYEYKPIIFIGIALVALKDGPFNLMGASGALLLITSVYTFSLRSNFRKKERLKARLVKKQRSSEVEVIRRTD